MHSLFFIGFLAGLMLSFPIGPNGSLCLYRSVRFGWPQGLATALGSVAAMSIWAVASFVLLSLFMERILAKSVESTIGTICGTLSILVGVIFLLTSKPKQIVARATSAHTMFIFNFSSSFFIGLANTKNMAGFAAVLMSSSPMLAKDALTPMQAAAFGCGVFLSTASLCLLNIHLSITVGEKSLRRAVPKLKYWVAGVFLFVGVVAIVRTL